MAVKRTFVVVMLALAAGAAWAGATSSTVPKAVSPGMAGGVARIAGACPSFSWGAVEGSQAYELVVYSAGYQSADGPVIAVMIPGTALSWTPSLDKCLAPGRRYVWFVRSTAETGVGAWSEGRVFEIATRPTIAEVERALEVLERFVRGSEGEASIDGEMAEDEAAGLEQPEPDVGAVTEESEPLTTGVEIAETAITIGGVEVVTAATDQDTLGGMSCADGELAKWHAGSSSWVCGAYAAGNQLFLDIDTFHVEDGSGSGLDADLLDGNDSLDFAQLGIANAFTANPVSSSVGGGPLFINPASGVKEDNTLLGVAVGGVQRFRVDIEGDVELAGSINRGLVVLPEVSGGSGYASPNVVAGHPSNSVTVGVAGAGIGGGGGRKISDATLAPNIVTDDFGTVGGGLGNRAGDATGTTADKRFATTAGGAGNTASGLSSTVGGGSGNLVSADFAMVGGGSQNVASGLGSAVGGGQYNEALAEGGAITGGDNNDVTDRWAAIGGGAYNVAGDAAGTASDEEFATVGGGFSNEARAGHAVIGGGNNNLVTDRFGTVGGGSENRAGDALGTTIDGRLATVGGGGGNTASGFLSTVGGGGNNRASGASATIAGGSENEAGESAFVGGGQYNKAQGLSSTIAGGDNNDALDTGGSIGGGYLNRAGDLAGGSTDNPFATVAGGSGNQALAGYGAIGGGYENQVTDQYGTVAGGGSNRAGDAAGTTTDHHGFAAVGGGSGNVASGRFSTVPGGADNEASGSYSLAAGRGARATHPESFVWGVGGGPASSTALGQFTVQIDSSFRIINTNVEEVFTVNSDGRLAVSDSSGANAASLVKGSATPGTGAALEVANSTSFGEVAWLYQMDPDTLQPVLKLLLPSGIPSNQLRNFLECEIPGEATPRKCHIDKNGTFHAGSDFAEALPAVGNREDYEPGDVLLIADDGSGVEKVPEPYSPRVAGVYSTRPGVLGADKDGETRVDETDVPMAIVGIVPTKVSGENGSIAVGDLLVTSGLSGHAMKGTDRTRMQGAIVGKALEPFSGERGVIRVLVSLL